MTVGVTDAPAADGLWVTVGQLAEMKGISHPAVSKRLRRYQEQGLLTARRDGTRTLVNLAEWDTVTAENTDPAKIAGLETSRRLAGQEAQAARPAVPFGGADGDPVYAREQARKAQYDADLKKIELDRQLGRLVEVHAVEAAIVASAEVLVNAVDQLPSAADDLAAALAKGGVPALRDALRAKARELRSVIEKGLVEIAARDADDDEQDGE